MKTNESDYSESLYPSRGVSTRAWWSRVVGRFMRLLLLALAVCALWLTIEDRWGSNFLVPTRYTGDSHYILAMMKLAKEGDLGLFTHITTESLGAPFTAQLNDFPQTERVIIWIAGHIAKVIGLMPATNAILMLSCAVGAASFYIAARLWRISRLAAWALAIVYAFLPQSQRSLDHIGIGFTGLLPLQFYCCWYIATAQKLSWSSFRLRLTLLISLLSGFLNIYWVFFFIHLYALAILCRTVKYRKGIIISLIPLAATCLVSVAFMASFIVYRASYGHNPAALVRSYFDAERWALKPIDLLLPNWGPYLNISSDFFSRYYDGGRLEIGEAWGAYLGLCSIAGLLLLFLNGTRRQLNKQSSPLLYLVFCWLIVYTGVGGIHTIISLILNFYDIRATNRYSEAIATLGLLYFAFSIHRGMRNWPFRAKLFSLALLAPLAIFDQSFQMYSLPSTLNSSIKERVTADSDLASTLESTLKAGAMIYTLPAMDFPEPFSGRGASTFGGLLL